jgi:hypothetical protein
MRMNVNNGSVGYSWHMRVSHALFNCYNCSTRNHVLAFQDVELGHGSTVGPEQMKAA